MRFRTLSFHLCLRAGLLLLGGALAGCSHEEPLHIPTPSAAAVAQQAAITRRVEELKKTHPGVPVSVLSNQAGREIQGQGGRSQQ